MKEPMWKNIVILFTGGLDSTYLLYKNLKEGNHVDIIYTKIQNNPEKTQSEIHAIDEIIVEMNRLFSPCSISFKYNSVEINALADGIRLKQLPSHMLTVMHGIHDLQSEVQLGYCMNDDMVSYIEDLKKLYESWMPFCAPGMPNITFPLLKIHKIDMLRELPKSLRDLVFSCENPPELCKPCGECDSCRKYQYLSKSYGREIFEETRLLSKMVVIADDPAGIEYELKKHTKQEELPLLINTRRITLSRPSLNLARSLSDMDEENQPTCQ